MIVGGEAIPEDLLTRRSTINLRQYSIRRWTRFAAPRGQRHRIIDSRNPEESIAERRGSVRTIHLVNFISNVTSAHAPRNDNTAYQVRYCAQGHFSVPMPPHGVWSPKLSQVPGVQQFNSLQQPQTLAE